MSFFIELSKERFKFSASHFTVFNESKAERLHGHNYLVSCKVETSSQVNELGMCFDFNTIKPMIKKICDQLDEYVLIPTESKYVSVEKLKTSYRVRFSTKTYEFPFEDSVLLPIVNITCEELCRYFLNQLLKAIENYTKMDLLNQIDSISLKVEESRGQSVEYKKQL